MSEYNFGGKITWSDEVLFTFLNYSFMFLFLIDFSYYLAVPRKVSFCDTVKSKFSKDVIFLCFILYAFIFSYKCYLDIKGIHTLGYTANISDIRINYPIWTVAAGTIFYIFFYMLLMHDLTKKETFIIFSVYVIVSFISGLKGARAAFFIPFIFTLFYLSEKKYIKINFFKLILLIFISVAVILLITISRGEELGYLKGLKDSFLYVFYNQTQTFNLPIFYLEHKDFCQSQRVLPYIFSDVLHLYKPSIMTGENVVHRFTGLPNGLGLGESLFLELLDLSFIGKIIFSILIGFSMKFVQINFSRNRKLVPLFCCFVSSSFYMSRDRYFKFLDPSSIIYFISTNILLSILLYIEFIFLKSKDYDRL